MRKKEVEGKVVRLRVRLEPAFKLIIEQDDTGKKWSGHTWYGNTGLDVLRNMRNSLRKGDYRNDEIKVTSSTPEIVAAISWKEPVYNK